MLVGTRIIRILRAKNYMIISSGFLSYKRLNKPHFLRHGVVNLGVRCLFYRQKTTKFSAVCVCLSVNRITQKLLIKFLWNFTEWLDIIQGPID